MTASLILVCLFLLVGLTGAPSYVEVSWAFALLGLFLTIGVLLMLVPGRRCHEPRQALSLDADDGCRQSQ